MAEMTDPGGARSPAGGKGGEPWVIDDALCERLMELTDGAAAPCFQCGVCTASCPWGLVGEESFSIRSFVRRAQIGVMDGWKAAWLCTGCGECEEHCPRGVPIVEVIRGLRGLMWEKGRPLPGLPSMLWSEYWNSNPWSQPPSQRYAWAKDLALPAYDPQIHEILLYVGCTSSYDRRAQKIARALIEVLRGCGVVFGVLGEREPCCGEAVRSVGHQPFFEDLAHQACQVFAEHGVGTLVTVSPHCQDVFCNHYPASEKTFQAMHYTQFLAQLLRDGRLHFEQAQDQRVTFQDPCLLGRWNGIFDEPRAVLDAIPELNLVEMKHSGPEALCCGGGGGRMWMETQAGERFSDLRVREAEETGASIIATACPFCISCLEDSIKSLKMAPLEVLDIAEIAARAIAPPR
jgi:Fe-S oxidoreductase